MQELHASTVSQCSSPTSCDAIAAEGLEPPQVASKTTVLPLDDAAVGPEGIEPPFFRLKGGCNHQLLLRSRNEKRQALCH